MILQSPFHDYYDGVVHSMGRDPSIVWKRTYERAEGHDRRVPVQLAIEELEFPYYRIPRYTPSGTYIERRDGFYDVGGIFFCGKLYVYLRHDPQQWGYVRGYAEPSKPVTFDYDPEATRQHVAQIYAEEHPNSKRTRIAASQGRGANHWIQKILGPMEAALPRDYVELHREYETPILAIHPGSRRNQHQMEERCWNLYPNPCLKEYDFQKVLDPFQTYQQLMGYLSGVLTRPDKEPLPITDKQRAVAHGFDAKTSFRNEEHPRKPRHART